MNASKERFNRREQTAPTVGMMLAVASLLALVLLGSQVEKFNTKTDAPVTIPERQSAKVEKKNTTRHLIIRIYRSVI